ncbi:MAG TPA: hypothetical protein VGI16_11080 [Candidatus Acidoferrum sp.]
MLLLPRRIVSGERATLAVLDVNGRLTPGVRVNFSNGDHSTTDSSGRALFVAPLTAGVISAVIAGRPGRVYATILTPAEAASTSLQVLSAPRIASESDRFEVSGRGFCGDADSNRVIVGGLSALVLAASPTSLVILPPADLEAGSASVQIECAKQKALAFSTIFVSLELEANSSPLAPGEHRELTVRVHGTLNRVTLDAVNLSPEVAELVGGSPVRALSSGGSDNVAHFELVGKQHGSFLTSIRLAPTQALPKP